MPYSDAEIIELAKRIGKGRTTLWRWAREGCDLHSPASIQAWLEKSARRQRNRTNNIGKPSLPMGFQPDPYESEPVNTTGNGEKLKAPGQRGAQFALQRLEAMEEESHRRLEAALESGNPIRIQACQDFWLKTAESVRRLDLSVELARRDAEEQVRSDWHPM